VRGLAFPGEIFIQPSYYLEQNNSLKTSVIAEGVAPKKNKGGYFLSNHFARSHSTYPRIFSLISLAIPEILLIRPFDDQHPPMCLDFVQHFLTVLLRYPIPFSKHRIKLSPLSE
jgi:hypothetical protein